MEGFLMFMIGFIVIVAIIIIGTCNHDDWHDNGHGGCG